jgi:hypothetical protein
MLYKTHVGSLTWGSKKIAQCHFVNEKITKKIALCILGRYNSEINRTFEPKRSFFRISATVSGSCRNMRHWQMLK